MKESKNNISLFDISSKTTLDAIIETFPYGVLFFNRKGKILYSNRRAEAILVLKKEDVVSQKFEALFTISSEKEKLIKLLHSETLLPPQKSVELEYSPKTGESIFLDLSFNSVDHKGNPLIMAVMRDSTHKVRLTQDLYERSISDPLTGLYNRRHFDKVFKAEFDRAKRYGRSLTIIVLDIDGFKQANDLYGHSFGDEMLLHLKEVLRDSLRKMDTPFRHGGDEFGIILPETPKESAFEIAERLRVGFLEKCQKVEERIKLSLSMGLASTPEDGENRKSLFATADMRMLQSKSNGGNTITAYTVSELLTSKESLLFKTLMDLAILTEKHMFYRCFGGICHSQKTRSLAMEIGRRMDLSSKRLTILEYASMLHDIGLLCMPKEVLQKPSAFTTEEHREISKHPSIGKDIIHVSLINSNRYGDLADIPEIVCQHHEHMDGTGYPKKLHANDILKEAKILSVVDSYEAMSSDRPHRKAFTKEKIVSTFLEDSGTKYDPETVQLLFELEGLNAA